jgi:hypothetical protein
MINYIKYLWNNKTLMSYSSYVFRVDALAYAKELARRRAKANKKYYKSAGLPLITVGKPAQSSWMVSYAKAKAVAAFKGEAFSMLPPETPVKIKQGKMLSEITLLNDEYIEKHQRDFHPDAVKAVRALKITQLDQLLYNIKPKTPWSQR